MDDLLAAAKRDKSVQDDFFEAVGRKKYEYGRDSARFHFEAELSKGSADVKAWANEYLPQFNAQLSWARRARVFAAGVVLSSAGYFVSDGLDVKHVAAGAGMFSLIGVVYCGTRYSESKPRRDLLDR